MASNDRKIVLLNLFRFIIYNILPALDKRNVIDSIYLKFSRAFDKVSHPLFFQKLEEFGFRG